MKALVCGLLALFAIGCDNSAQVAQRNAELEQHNIELKARQEADIARIQREANIHYLSDNDGSMVWSSDSPDGFEQALGCEHEVWDCSHFASPVTCHLEMRGLCRIAAGIQLLDDHTSVKVIGTFKTAHFSLTGVQIQSGSKTGKETWVFTQSVK